MFLDVGLGLRLQVCSSEGRGSFEEAWALMIWFVDFWRLYRPGKKGRGISRNQQGAWNLEQIQVTLFPHSCDTKHAKQTKPYQALIHQQMRRSDDLIRLIHLAHHLIAWGYSGYSTNSAKRVQIMCVQDCEQRVTFVQVLEVCCRWAKYACWQLSRH